MVRKCNGREALANVANRNDAIKDEVESLAWCVAKIPTCDLHGYQFKAALFALLADLELGKPPGNAKEAVLVSLIHDLVRDTPWWSLLSSQGKSGSRASRRVPRRRSEDRVGVKPLTGDIETLRLLMAEEDDGQEGICFK
jgi:hypothetical protein